MRLEEFSAWVSNLIEKGNQGAEAPRPIDWSRIKVESMINQPFPKNLGAPDSDPENWIRDAINSISRSLDADSPVAVSFWNSVAAVKCISPPRCTRQELPQIIAYEAKQQFPFDVEDAQVRCLPAGEHCCQEGYLMSGVVILAAVQNAEVQKSIELFGDLQPRLDLLTDPVFPRAELGKALLANNPEGVIALIEMHSEHSTLIVIDKMQLWTRRIPIGGNHFTTELAKKYEIPFAEAENLKVNAMAADNPRTVFLSMKGVFENLSNEIARSVLFRNKCFPAHLIDKLVITGGPSKLTGLVQYLGNNLNLPVRELSSQDIPIDGLGSEDTHFITPSFLAAQRVLGNGMFLANFMPNAEVFGPGAKAAWAINIGYAGITAVKVSLKEQS